MQFFSTVTTLTKEQAADILLVLKETNEFGCHGAEVMATLIKLVSIEQL